jgi:hypothetical protein
MKKRILVLLSAVALMVMMVAMSVAPASAVGILTCYKPGGQINVLANDRDLALAEGYTKCRGLNAPAPSF